VIDKFRNAVATQRASEAVSPYIDAMKHDLAPHVTKRLRRRMRVLMFIGSILLLTAAYEVAAHHIGLALALLAVGVGLGIGLLMGRISLFSWDDEAKRVTSRVDRAGAILLIVYVLLVMNRREILGHWLTADTLAAASFAMAGGTLMGRNFAMRKRILGILTQVGLIPSQAGGSQIEAAL
jgi:hypothetical protein